MIAIKTNNNSFFGVKYKDLKMKIESKSIQICA